MKTGLCKTCSEPYPCPAIEAVEYIKQVVENGNMYDCRYYKPDQKKLFPYLTGELP